MRQGALILSLLMLASGPAWADGFRWESAPMAGNFGISDAGTVSAEAAEKPEQARAILRAREVPEHTLVGNRVTLNEFRASKSPKTGPIQVTAVSAPTATPTVQTALAPTQNRVAPVRVAPVDPRVRKVRFEPDQVIRIDLKLRFITAIEFALGETVTSVLAGDSESFEIVRLKAGNILSVKPLVGKARTNINVYTNRRTYVLDVREGQRKRLTHRVEFIYPEDQAGPGEQATRPALSGPAASLNRDYSAAGAEEFRPIEAWDDGEATYFRFARTARRPAIFWSDAVGADYATNPAQIDRDTVRIGIVRDRWTLRIGNEVVCVVKGSVPERLQIALKQSEGRRVSDATQVRETHDDQ